MFARDGFLMNEAELILLVLQGGVFGRCVRQQQSKLRMSLRLSKPSFGGILDAYESGAFTNQVFRLIPSLPKEHLVGWTLRRLLAEKL